MSCPTIANLVVDGRAIFDDMDDLLTRIASAKMYPPFVAKLRKLLEACAERGAIYVPTSGIRTYEEQDVLYARGRTAPPIGAGHVVTKARGGYSPHNFNVAADCTRHKLAEYHGKLSPDYRDSAYDVLAEEAAKLKLEPGLRWQFKDAPHVQLPLKAHGISWAMMREWYESGGIDRVFKELDGRGPW